MKRILLKLLENDYYYHFVYRLSTYYEILFFINSIFSALNSYELYDIFQLLRFLLKWRLIALHGAHAYTMAHS